MLFLHMILAEKCLKQKKKNPVPEQIEANLASGNVNCYNPLKINLPELIKI